ncbi:MAG: arginine deiminase family protein [Actinomycetota bacterium]
MTGSKPPWAVVKPPPSSFFRAISSHPKGGFIDPARALRQHHEYQETLGSIVERLVVMEPNELHPDSCFTQDTAVVLQSAALLARSGIGVRKAELPAVKKVLQQGLVNEIHEVPPPGSLEGGDVLRVGKTLVVGRSRRTSSLGIEALTGFAEPLGYRVVPVDVPSGLLHLSTAVTVLNDELVIGLPEVLRNSAFAGLEQIPVTDGPLEACNVLAVGRHVIASGSYEVHDVLERKGFIVHGLDLGEFVKADAGPTCLALLPLA